MNFSKMDYPCGSLSYLRKQHTTLFIPWDKQSNKQ